MQEGETAGLKSAIPCEVSLRVTLVINSGAYTAAQLVLGSPGFSCVDMYNLGLSFIEIPPFPFNKGTCIGLEISKAELDWADHLFLLAPSMAYRSWEWFSMGNPGSEETE
ncbi:hypothetical protein D5086_019291 [Populus alba]|uniref:Uncharacterized protein n=1 Tax=Populus alba TaxID=43335 RepID=A0ACC4BHG2_POPAL